MSKTALVLLSGGIDSSTALYWAKREGYDIKCLSINYFNRPKKEIDASKELCALTGAECVEVSVPFVMEIDDLKDFDFPLTYLDKSPSGYIPMKNMLFYSIAGYYSELFGIHCIIGGQILSDEDLYPDASREYFDCIKELINKGAVSHKDNPLKIKFPFIDMSKAEVIKQGFEMKVPYEMAWSCYEDEQIPCGICKGCVERNDAFKVLNLKDPQL